MATNTQLHGATVDGVGALHRVPQVVLRRTFCLFAGAVVTVGVSLLLTASAMGADMTGAAIKELITDKTVYVELTLAPAAELGWGIIYYATDGTALYTTPMGDNWHGTWAIKDDTACVTWKEARSMRCARYDKQGDVVRIINAATGKPRGKIVMIAPGNIEHLAP